MLEMPKTLGLAVFVSETERVKSYPDFEKLVHVIQHGLQKFIVKNMEAESAKTNNLSHIL